MSLTPNLLRNIESMEDIRDEDFLCWDGASREGGMKFVYVLRGEDIIIFAHYLVDWWIRCVVEDVEGA